ALDGEDLDGPFARLHERLAAVLPHGSVRHEARSLAATLGELSSLLERRQSGEDADHTPVLVTVFALQRLRQLRPDDDLGGRDGGEPPAERFARILANGPEYGVHTLVWCDSLASVQRGLGRRSLRDFDQRILFQMSAADSTELVDDDGASRLGLHTALVAAQGEGRREKFRPFALPGPEFLARLAAALTARFPRS
nr:cell division protein FtsK [Planctomycetota bacterium]